jgi:hypothetical protein
MYLQQQCNMALQLQVKVKFQIGVLPVSLMLWASRLEFIV